DVHEPVGECPAWLASSNPHDARPVATGHGACITRSRRLRGVQPSRPSDLDHMEAMNDVTATKPRVLLVYYTYTQQSRMVAEAMGEVFRERGCDVSQAAIEFTDSRYAERFSRFP